MNKTWNGIKDFLEGRAYAIMLALMSVGAGIYYLSEPLPDALNAFLVDGDVVPLLLLFDLIGALVGIALGTIMLIFRLSLFVWAPFAIAALFLIPKLFVLHTVAVEFRGPQLLIGYALLLGILPGIYFGWKIRTAVLHRRREEEDNSDK